MRLEIETEAQESEEEENETLREMGNRYRSIIGDGPGRNGEGDIQKDAIHAFSRERFLLSLPRLSPKSSAQGRDRSESGGQNKGKRGFIYERRTCGHRILRCIARCILRLRVTLQLKCIWASSIRLCAVAIAITTICFLSWLVFINPNGADVGMFYGSGFGFSESCLGAMAETSPARIVTSKSNRPRIFALGDPHADFSKTMEKGNKH